MVGAGMSRNARQLDQSVRPIPLWPDIVQALADRLDVNDTSDALRVGEIYARTFGRSALDNFLVELVRDELYEPGALHHSLLDLPWSDIFTTNYDTLLERARRGVPLRRWDVVATCADLATAARPRIVKLHGTFHSHRPFIFTSEDYRTYPRNFAPFVNTVQQAVMEGTLCLLGYSGGDPNFQQWAGWVRDNLGEAAPRIYICGVLDLTPAKVRLFDSLRVTPVDLGRLEQSADALDAGRHARALTWFFDQLSRGAPPDASDWPRLRRRPNRRAATPGFGPEAERSGGGQGDPFVAATRSREPEATANPVEDFDEFRARLRKSRETYPGWAVCPEQNREALWSQLQADTFGLDYEFLTKSVHAAPRADSIDVVYDVLWHHRCALVPATSDLGQLAASMFASVAPTGTSSTVPKHSEAREREIQGRMILLEIASIYGDAAQYLELAERLRMDATLKPEWLARWFFERAWHHLMLLEFDEAEKVLRAWPGDRTLCFWEGKRAALLAELGYVEEAEKIAVEALERTRAARDQVTEEVGSLSREGWLIRLLEVLHRSPRGADVHRSIDGAARLKELARYRADPLVDLEAQAAKVQAPDKRGRTEKTVVRAADYQFRFVAVSGMGHVHSHS